MAGLWLNSERQDFVNTAPDDNGYNATNGCTTLFIYYLFHQLGYTINQIVSAGSATLAGVYKNLTADSNDPFPLFEQLLDARFPSRTSSAVPGPNFDDPWPLGAISYTGVWRAGQSPYDLWTHASQSDFLAKWQMLASQNLRLTDVDVTTINGQQLWSGIWEGGTDAYYLWINADQDHFLAKWSELATQNLRLVGIRNYNGLWAGVWREGTDAYYLWIDADQDHFLAKWSELAAQNLRLVDFDVSTVNGQRRWSGVWRSGSDGYYLWINASWQNFVVKWSELAAQKLRLIGVRTYDGLWAGIWRSGTDDYYLWANANESSFLAKWAGLAGQNLRLIDLVTMPAGGATGADAFVSTGATLNLGKERIGSSELTRGGGSAANAGSVHSTSALSGSSGVGEGGGSFISVGTAHSKAAEGVGEGGGSVTPATSSLAHLGNVGRGGGNFGVAARPLTSVAVDAAGAGGGTFTSVAEGVGGDAFLSTPHRSAAASAGEGRGASRIQALHTSARAAAFMLGGRDRLAAESERPLLSGCLRH